MLECITSGHRTRMDSMRPIDCLLTTKELKLAICLSVILYRGIAVSCTGVRCEGF